jgi:hypothetical protein
MLETRTLASGVNIEIVAETDVPFAANVEQQIDEVWKAENAKRISGLFNGPILSFVSYESETIQARVTDYRHFLAQRRVPELFDVLAIRPLAVSGLVSLGSKIAFGKRASNTTQDANRWELVPSGGLTPRARDQQGNISAKAQVLEELKEELGLPDSLVGSTRPFILVEDTAAHVIDIGFHIELSASADEVKAAMANRTDEYSGIDWVDKSDIDQFCNARDVIPVSLALLQGNGLTSRR